MLTGPSLTFVTTSPVLKFGLFEGGVLITVVVVGVEGGGEGVCITALNGEGVGVGGGGVHDEPGCVALAHSVLKVGKKNITTVQSVNANRSAPALTPMSKGWDLDRGGWADIFFR